LELCAADTASNGDLVAAGVTEPAKVFAMAFATSGQFLPPTGAGITSATNLTSACLAKHGAFLPADQFHFV